MKTQRQIAALLLGVSLTWAPAFALSQTPTTSQDPGLKQDAKDAGHEVKKAAEDTGHAVKKNTKKAANKTAQKTDQGAQKVEDKTHPNQ